MIQSDIPRYLRVYSLLKGQIENNEYKLGEFLPPEYELEKTFNVSRTTVRKAVEMLARQGFVYVKQGKGTEVMDFRATQNLRYVTSFSETLREQGFAVSYADVTVVVVPAPRRLAADLRVEASSRVVRVDRVVMADRKPIAMIRNYLLPDMVPGIKQKAGKISSLYSFLESEYNIVLDAATDCITAKVATPGEAEVLRVPVGTPLLEVRRVTESGGKPVEIAELRIVADKYEYSVHTKDRPPRSALL
jgi:GntR family transcriptional regulator